MCQLMLSELSDEQRNSYGLPVSDDTEYMGANMLDEPNVPDWYRQATAQNLRKRTFERALFWATLVGVWFGLLIGFTVSLWWLT